MRQNVNRTLWLGLLLLIIGLLWPATGHLQVIALPFLVVGFSLILTSHFNQKP
mgnify:CR=1 FL=1